MRAIDYALRQAWASLWRSRASTAFAVVAIALAMTVLGTLLLLTSNVEQLLLASGPRRPSSPCTSATTRRRNSAARSRR